MHHQTQPSAARVPTRHKGFTYAAALLIVLLGLAWRAQPDNRLHVSFLQTDGDAVLVQTPDGKYMLIDGGDPIGITAALGRALPFWRRSLDAVVLTAPDPAYTAGQVAVLARYQAKIVLAPPLAAQNNPLPEWRSALDEQAVPIHSMRAGEQTNIGGVTLRVLASGDGKKRGAVLRLDYGSTSVVFCQSSAEEDEASLARNNQLHAATLVAFPWQRDPHTPLIEALQPQAMVLTDGHHAMPPYEATMAERRVGNARLYHKDVQGTIEWISDGTRSWVSTDNAQQ
jgi:beta-lactamase superfamily II metal-dependent hydrolase